MVRPIPTHASSDPHLGSVPLAVGLFLSVSALVALCAKHARRGSTKSQTVEPVNDTPTKFQPRSPLRSPKQLIATISNKAINIPFINHRKAAGEADDHGGGGGAEEGFGEGGLWQKSILMGEKCQPPEFSGVIYYDSCGHRISELPPRSPRASPLYTTFSFQVPTDAN